MSGGVIPRDLRGQMTSRSHVGPINSLKITLLRMRCDRVTDRGPLDIIDQDEPYCLISTGTGITFRNFGEKHLGSFSEQSEHEVNTVLYDGNVKEWGYVDFTFKDSDDVGGDDFLGQVTVRVKQTPGGNEAYVLSTGTSTREEEQIGTDTYRFHLNGTNSNYKIWLKVEPRS
jgi:hypothetical protein